MPKLLIQEGGQQSVFELFEDEASIGRGAANAIQVADNHASKHHAVIRRLHGRAKLVDLESKNGTRVNGEFRNQKWLDHGDVVTIGALTIHFDASDAAIAPTPAPVAAAPAVSISPSLQAAPAAAYAPPPPPRTRRAREEDVDGDRRGGRVPARRGTNSGPVALLVGIGVIGVIAIFFLLMRGKAGNAQVLAAANRIYDRGDHDGAIRYLKANGDPSNEDSYESIAGQLKTWESIEEHRPEDAKESQATKALNQLERDRIEMWKNGISEVEMGRRLLKFLDDFKETREAAALQHAQYEPYTKMRVLIEKARAEK